MNTKSLRFRLTLWYAISFIIALSVVFATLYLVTKQVLLAQTDATLSSHGSQIVKVITVQNTGMEEMMARQAYLAQLEQAPGMLVVILDNKGGVLGSSQKTVLSQQSQERIFIKAQSVKEPFFMDESVNAVPMRFWVDPVYENNDLGIIVLMGHPTEIIQTSLNRLLTTFGVVFFVFLIPTVVGGYLHARAALEPIGRISDALKRISHENLNQRVDVPNSRDEVAELARTFNGLLDRLQGAFMRERQFIADVAHELKTPLSILRSTTDVTLSKDRTKEEYKKALIETRTDTKNITETLKNILDLASSMADQAVSLKDQVNLSLIVSELQDMAEKLAVAKRIVVEGTIESDIIINGIEDKLSRALINIIDNAVTYTPRKGRITISLHSRGDKAILHIQDTGAGITKEDLTHVFERYYRGKQTGKTYGSGLGLAIAKATILAHRGTIDVASVVGKGTTFTITLSRFTTSS